MKFIQHTDTNKEIATSAPNQEVIDSSRGNISFQFTVSEGFFISEIFLQQQMAKIHFCNNLLEIHNDTETSEDIMYQSSEFTAHISTTCRLWSAVILPWNTFTLPINPKLSQAAPASVT